MRRWLRIYEYVGVKMSEKGGIDLGQIITIGALILGGYLVVKYILPGLKALNVIPDAISNVLSGLPGLPGLPGAPGISGLPGLPGMLETTGGVPGAVTGLLYGGPLGAIVGGEVGKWAAPKTVLETPGYMLGGILGGLFGPAGMLAGSQVGKALSPTHVEQVQPMSIGTIIGGIAGPVGMIIGSQIGKATAPTPGPGQHYQVSRAGIRSIAKIPTVAQVKAYRQTAAYRAIVTEPSKTSVHGLINPATGFRYSGR